MGLLVVSTLRGRQSPFEVRRNSLSAANYGKVESCRATELDMNNTIMRFVKSTTAVESGFIAAGLTVSIAAVIGALLYVFSI
jgi:hypothetical protein